VDLFDGQPRAAGRDEKAVIPLGQGPPVRATRSATFAQVPLVMTVFEPVGT
jgi:hypothetical protein